MKDIAIEPEVVDYITHHGRDFRLSTSCYGPVIVPLEVKPPKETDLRIQVNGNTLYVSRVQARYIDRITKRMLCDVAYLRSCSVFKD
jgi:hypothetical protein